MGIGIFKPNSARISDIAAASGVIIEFISGIFFYLYNRTILQLKNYHASLLGGQNILLSFKIVEDLKSESDKVKMLEKMLTFLVSKPEIQQPEIEREPTEPVSNT